MSDVNQKSKKRVTPRAPIVLLDNHACVGSGQEHTEPSTARSRLHECSASVARWNHSGGGLVGHSETTVFLLDRGKAVLLSHPSVLRRVAY